MDQCTATDPPNNQNSIAHSYHLSKKELSNTEKHLRLCEICVDMEDGVWCPQQLEFQDKWNKLQSYHSVREPKHHLALES